jgi:hypothetical protein
MSYTVLPDGSKRWTRNGYMGRSRPARSPFQAKPDAKRPKRNYSRRLGTAKPKEGTWKWYADKLESLLAQRAKMRDGYQCRQCCFDGAPTQGQLDAGHIYPKGKFPGGKYLIENIVAQCRDHNTKHIGRPEYMMLWYDAEHGDGARERLHKLVLAQPRRQSIEWLKQAIEESEAAIKEMQLLEAA